MKKSLVIFITSIILLHCPTAFAEDIKVKQLYSGAIKGSAIDYYPNIFKKHSLITVSAVTANPWAGKVYLMKNHPKHNMAAATASFYRKAVDNVKEYGSGFCQAYLDAKGYKKGFYFVDNFETSQIYEDGIAHYMFSANIMCFSR